MTIKKNIAKKEREKRFRYKIIIIVIIIYTVIFFFMVTRAIKRKKINK